MNKKKVVHTKFRFMKLQFYSFRSKYKLTFGIDKMNNKQKNFPKIICENQ